jgi:hypothetical protein
MKESRKEFIKKAHSAACSEWKENIEKEFPKLFKGDALEVGKWYKLTKDYIHLKKGSVFPFIKYQDSLEECAIVGHSIFDNSKTDFFAPFSNTLTPATEKEVEEALIKEAKKRGFKDGVKYKNRLDSFGFINDSCWEFNGKSNYLGQRGNKVNRLHFIFDEGKWAEIIKETITKEQAEKELGKTILN